MEFDLHSNIKQSVALNFAAITTNTTTVGNIIDTLDFDSLEFIVQSGAITDGTYTFLLQEGDASNMSDATTLSAEETLGSLTGFIATDDNAAKRVGSIGKKRYQRLSIVSASTSTGVNSMTAVAVQGNPRQAPVAE